MALAVFVCMKSDEIRIHVDYRELNLLSSPLARQSTGPGSNVFSTFDP